MKGTCSHCGQDVEHTCLWCGEPAVAFCDAWIGGETIGGLYTISLPQFTCDAPLCSEHRKLVGWVCGKDPDTLDYCPTHQADKVTVHSAAKSKVEAESMRRAAWAEGRRARMRAASQAGERP